jgi:hypothetical protein
MFGSLLVESAPTAADSGCDDLGKLARNVPSRLSHQRQHRGGNCFAHGGRVEVEFTTEVMAATNTVERERIALTERAGCLAANLAGDLPLQVHESVAQDAGQQRLHVVGVDVVVLDVDVVIEFDAGVVGGGSFSKNGDSKQSGTR